VSKVVKILTNEEIYRSMPEANTRMLVA